MFARFDENPAMTLKEIKEIKRYGRTHGKPENSIPTTNKVCGGYYNCSICFRRLDCFIVHVLNLIFPNLFILIVRTQSLL